MPAGQTQWSSVGAPYRICAGGVTVPSGAGLVLDASSGGFAVQAQGAGGLSVAGTLRTVGTTAATPVTWTGPSARAGSWSGLSGTAGATVALDHVAVADAATGLATLDPTSFTITNSTIRDSSVDGIVVTVTTRPTAAPTISDTSVSGSHRYGVAVHGPTGDWTPVHLQRVSASSGGVATDANRAEAVWLDRVNATYGPGGDVDAVQGGGNGIDAIAWTGTLTPSAGALPWPTVTDSPSAHVLGLLPVGLSVAGDVAVPAGGIVKGTYLTVDGGLTAAAGAGAAPIFDSADDATAAGVPTCPSTLVDTCGLAQQWLTVAAPRGRSVSFSGVETDALRADVQSADQVTISNSDLNDGSELHTATATVLDHVTGAPFHLTSDGPDLRITNCSFNAQIYDDAGTLTIDNSTINGFLSSGMEEGHPSGLTDVSITRSTFRGGGAPVIDISGSAVFDQQTGLSTYRPRVTMQDDTLVGVQPPPGYTFHPLAARLADVTFSLGPTGSISRVTGIGQPDNAIGLSGEEDGGFPWVSPSTNDGPVGYATIGGLDVFGPGTVTVPANGVVKGAGMRLIGASLDASAGGASFVPINDPSAGPLMCPATNGDDVDCGGPNEGTGPDSLRATGVTLAPDRTTHLDGSISMVRATGHRIAIGEDSDNRLFTDVPAGGSVSVLSSTMDRASVGKRWGSETLQNDTFTRSSVGAAYAAFSFTSSSISCSSSDGDCGPTSSVAGPLAAVSAYESADLPVTITDDTVSGATVEVRGAQEGGPRLDHLTVRHLTVTGAGRGFELPDAVELIGVKVRIGPGLDVDDVGGMSNAQDAMLLTGEVDGGFTWTGEGNSATRHPLGIVGINGEGGLSLVGPGTVTVPANAMIKAGLIHLDGVTLDASAGGATLTGVGNLDVGPQFCGPYDNCRLPFPEGQLNIDSDASTVSDVRLVNATVSEGVLSIAGPDGQPHLHWNGGSGTRLQLTATGVALELRSVDFFSSEIYATRSSGNVLDHLNLGRRYATIFGGFDASTTISSSLFNDTSMPEGYPATGSTIETQGNSSLQLSCDQVIGGWTSGVHLRGSGSIADSDFYDNVGGDVEADGPTQIPVSDVWGGSSSGVTNFPFNLVQTAIPQAQHPSASLALSGTATNPDGSLHDGTLQVSVTTSRRMDQSVPLLVTLTGPDQKAHPVNGAWVDGTHWSGTYQVSSSTASSGPSTVQASAGRGCIPNPDTNLMTPASTSVNVVVAPAPAPTAIDQKYAAMGGSTSVLGAPTGNELAVAGGRERHYQYGDIYWSAASGAHEVQGAILAKYNGLGGPAGVLGFPTTDETTTPDGKGRFNHFTGTGGSSIYWTPSTGAHSVQGAIRVKWAATGWERGVLGYPVTDESTPPDRVGRYNHFNGGSIYWSPSTGAHVVRGAIRDRWASLGWERSRLGYPTTDEAAVTGGQQSTFQHGRIFWRSSNGAITVTYS